MVQGLLGNGVSIGMKVGIWAPRRCIKRFVSRKVVPAVFA